MTMEMARLNSMDSPMPKGWQKPKVNGSRWEIQTRMGFLAMVMPMHLGWVMDSVMAIPKPMDFAMLTDYGTDWLTERSHPRQPMPDQQKACHGFFGCLNWSQI